VSQIELSSVSKLWGDTRAVDDVSFTVEEGTFAVLLGPSGCGKSTTLRLIAGLEEVSEGTVHIAGEDVTRKDPARRGVSMVFQSYALFPHLSVAENIVFGLKVRKVPAADRAERLKRVAALVGLEALLHRRPAQLSGGQRQRVALARAIVAENPICLMDEPLSNLDAKLRVEMRGEIRALQQRLGITMVYVTHDQIEAMSMADRVMLMNAGRLEQVGAPHELYERPATAFAARFVGTPPMNLLRLRPVDGGAAVDGDPEGLPVIGRAAAGWQLGVRPEHVEVIDNGNGGERGLSSVITALDYHGADTVVTLRIGEQEILARVAGRFGGTPGLPVRVRWPEAHAHVFDDNGCRQDEMPFALSKRA
jgi:sn-glycerol 3-phosphate transport system ATP-binding protein